MNISVLTLVHVHTRVVHTMTRRNKAHARSNALGAHAWRALDADVDTDVSADDADSAVDAFVASLAMLTRDALAVWDVSRNERVSCHADEGITLRCLLVQVQAQNDMTM